MVAGVCGGIATDLEIDPILVRAGFVVLALFTQGVGLLAYAVLWVVMPEDTTEPVDPTTSAPRLASSGSMSGSLVLGVLLIAMGSIWLLGSVTALRVEWGVVASSR